MIFNIQKCSIHDGNGLRTLVFFKGCPLHCPWCANPESQSYQKEIMESPVRCIGCGACAAVCPENAIGEDFRIDRERCTGCLKCIDVCYAESKKIAGRDYTVEELYCEIDKDRGFYRRYGGGVTFSGGEPLTHSAYLKKIAEKCHSSGINVVVESCGFGNYEGFREALPYIDAMFIDIKCIDSEKHREMTGVGNEQILENIRRISDFGVPVTIRTPVVPGYTDSVENIEGIARFIRNLSGIREYELLAYHQFGKPKYRSLGRAYALDEVPVPDNEKMNDLVRRANRILDGSGKECFWTKNNKKEVIK
ncbi:MAG: glycyl-radical enzyme activating protein [Emergencia sp.]